MAPTRPKTRGMNNKPVTVIVSLPPQSGRGSRVCQPIRSSVSCTVLSVVWSVSSVSSIRWILRLGVTRRTPGNCISTRLIVFSHVAQPNLCSSITSNTIVLTVISHLPADAVAGLYWSKLLSKVTHVYPGDSPLCIPLASITIQVRPNHG